MKIKLFILAICLMGSFSLQAASVLPGPLVESDWLAKNIDKVVILDVRKDVKSFTSKPGYKKDKKSGKVKLVKVGGHIPGALLVNYKKVRTKKMIDGREVTRILPNKADFEKFMQSVGLNKDDNVVIVSKGSSNSDMTMATRLYWQLKYFGHQNQAILNGGMAQWILDKRKVNSKAKKVKEGNWLAQSEDKSIFASSEDVEKAVKAGNIQLIDTRSPSLYHGIWRKGYVYSKGHIPGAKNYPNELLTQPKLPAKFVSANNTKTLLSSLNIDTNKETITYCNSGHLAAGSWFLMSEVLGNKNVKMYDGSMHQWTLEKRKTDTLLK